MATYELIRSTSATLTGTTIDVLTLRSSGVISVENRGSGTLWVTAGRAPVDPTVAGSGCIPVDTGETKVIRTGNSAGDVVKILGNGQAYTVTSDSRRTREPGVRVVTTTRAAYVALASKDPDTLYVIPR